ncbi:MAG: hypothetical protein R3284_04015, partial [Rubricoccaceae bacterium]|nr:hypothetical protein [Rubricoccaceae bacterium]
DQDDTKLQRLLDLIRQEQRQNQQQAQNESDPTSEQNNDQENGAPSTSDNQSGDDDRENDSSRPDDSQSAESDLMEGEQNPEESPGQEQNEASGRDESQLPQNDRNQPGPSSSMQDINQNTEMTREQAERILRAVGADELNLLQSLVRRRLRARDVERDW